MGKHLLLALFLPLILICTSCTKQVKQQDLTISMKEAPRSLDPREARLLSDITLAKHLYEGLVEENENGDIQLALAQSYSVSEDGLTYVFKLKPVFWSNGEALKSQDFINSWKDVVSHKVTSIYEFVFDSIHNIDAFRTGALSLDNIGLSSIDDQTLEIKLQRPVSHFLKLLALPVFYPVYQKKSSSPHTITNGAFHLADFDHKIGMRLEKNPFYHRKSLVKTPTMQIRFIQDPHTAALFFNKKMIHWQGPPWGSGIPKESFAHLKKTGELHSANVAGTSWILFNTHSYPFSNSKLRQALSLSIDKQRLSASLNHVQPAYHLIPSILHKYPQNIPSSEEERRLQAQKLFKEALEELNLSIKDLESYPILFSSSSQVNSFLAHMIREQWKEMFNFSTPIIGKEFATLQTDLTNKQFALAIGAWFADFSDPMTFLSIFSYPNGLPTYAINNHTFSRLLHNIQIETEKEKRLELISEASLYLEQLHIIEPLYHEVFHFALSKNLTNFYLSSTGIADLRFAETLD